MLERLTRLIEDMEVLIKQAEDAGEDLIAAKLTATQSDLIGMRMSLVVRSNVSIPLRELE